MVNQKSNDRRAVSTNNIPQRDYLFDNLRAILIIFVVWGHMLTSMIFEYDSFKIIYYFMFFFHMPAMVFISGYFSKNIEKARDGAFATILIPYLILNMCNYLYKMFIIQEDYFGFRFFRPLWGLWYLLAIFLWKFFLKDLIRIRFILPLSFLVGILSGFSKEFSTYLALGRIICLLPFFLLGYYTSKDHVEKIRKVPRLVSVAIISATALLSAYIVNRDIFKVEVLYIRKPYPEASDVKHMLFRCLVYVVALLMIYAMLNLTSRKRCFLSKIGTSTMTIYILHLFTIPLLEKLEIFRQQPYLYLLYSILLTVLITYVYSRPWVKSTYDTIINKITSLIIRKNHENEGKVVIK